MSSFVEEAIERAGLAPMLACRRAGDVESVIATATTWADADLLVLGAVADLLRAEDVGEVVRIHERQALAGEPDGQWVSTSHASELDLLRAVAVARIVARKGARIGVDWSLCGMELAQVALGFGASDLRGPIQRKSGLVILEGEKLKLKGHGMVELRAIKRQEIGALVTHAGRRAMFIDEETSRTRAPETTEEVASV